MDIAQMMDIALADIDDRRVEVMTLESAEFSIEAVGGLAGVIVEMVGNALALVPSKERVRVTGAWDHDKYRISILAGGMEISDEVVAVLNRMLKDPGLALGLASVAHLAARHNLSVRLAPEIVGMTFQVTVPAELVRRTVHGAEVNMVEEPEVTFVPHELERRVLVPSENVRDETEAFLESVFGALRNPWREPDRPEPAVLRVRVPGESYSVTEDDSPSTAAAEAAVDIRSALTTFDQGRRSAGVAG
jgi:hypothetical protein